jgi:hypothetical protein
MNLTLPTEKTAPVGDLSKETFLIYGPPKVGKSSLCAQFPDAIFIATEPGLRALDTFEVHPKDWEELLGYCTELAKAEHGYKTVVIDTLDNAYRMCSDYICKRNGNVDHPTDIEGMAKGWTLISNEILRVFRRLHQLGLGVILISHLKDQPKKTRTGLEYTVIAPSLSGGTTRQITAFADIIMLYDMATEKKPKGGSDPKVRRILRTSPHPDYEAGGRIPLPDTIEAGNSPAEAYANIVKAYKEATKTETAKESK